MMKKIILAIGLMFGGVAFVNAQQTQQQDTTQTQQSDQYRSDTTSTDDSQNQQNQDQTQSDTTSTQQSDMYRTEGEGNVSDSTSNNTDASTTNDTDAASNQTTTGTESTTTTETESTTTGSTGTPTTDDQMSSDQSGVSQDQEQEGEKIEVAELPAAVQTKLQSTDYQGWVVTSARKKMWSDPDNAQATSKEVYVIEAKNGSETKKLKFDKEGNEIEHDKHKKDDQK